MFFFIIIINLSVIQLIYVSINLINFKINNYINL
jgi:hypothetical protein